MRTLWTTNKNGIVKVSEKGFNLSKTGQIIESFLACRNGRIEIGELLEVACKPSFEKYGKVDLTSLPNWKDIKTFCLNSMYTCYKSGGNFWDIQFSNTGKTAYFVSRAKNKLPVTFEIKEETPKAEATKTETEAESTNEATVKEETLASDAWSKASALLTSLRDSNQLSEAIFALEEIQKGGLTGLLQELSDVYMKVLESKSA